MRKEITWLEQTGQDVQYQAVTLLPYETVLEAEFQEQPNSVQFHIKRQSMKNILTIMKLLLKLKNT